MFGLPAIGFLNPWLLLGLLTLPILWWLLRAVPPAAVRRRFPAVTMLLGLQDPESTPVNTPWWLLLIRMLAVALLIIGFAGPVLNPEDVQLRKSPLLVLLDASWASATDWDARRVKLDEVLALAGQQGRRVAVVSLSDSPFQGDAIPWQDASVWASNSARFAPRPYAPDDAAFSEWLNAIDAQGFDTVWFSDGLARAGRDALTARIQQAGDLRVIQSTRAILGLRPPVFADGNVVVTVLRSRAVAARRVTVRAYGPDPQGVERRLAAVTAVFDADALETEAVFDLPSELRNRIRFFDVESTRAAGAVALADDALKRRKVALFAGVQAREGQEFVSSLHFLRKALAPTAELIEAPVRDSLLASPDVVVLADVAKLTGSEERDLLKWVEDGGLLVRFAGPKLAARTANAPKDDPLLPVRLRAGGRNIGGAMSWGSPRELMPFDAESPFFGLDIPADVTVSSQVLAQPDPELSAHTIASLMDGTPLVTQAHRGDGRVVLVHVTANAEWSTLPISGLFVEMLERLAVSTRNAVPTAGQLAGQVWVPQIVLDGFGNRVDAGDMAGVAGEVLAKAVTGPDLLPGIYGVGTRQVALNVLRADSLLSPAQWRAGVHVDGFVKPVQRALKPALLMAALGLMLLDIFATLWLGGRLTGPRAGIVTTALLALFLSGDPGAAQSSNQSDTRSSDAAVLRAVNDTVLAYVKTGDSRVDQKSEAGLFGLGLVLRQRTAVEPAEPVAVDLERDELAFFPLIYWPISENQPALSEAANDKINRYLRTGGMILFDTRDSNLGRFGSGTPNGRRLQQLAASLDIPALEPIPSDHVLTRSYYLLQDFPGRHRGRDVWVEAAPANARKIEGVPFRNLNDGVSPVVIGGNDWAAAWALSRQGQPMYPVGRGGTGQRQREIAYRFGVNLVMYVLTGNYKSDQVHVPALLERLGQ